MTQPHESAWPQDLLEREVVITRVIDAPLALVDVWSRSFGSMHTHSWLASMSF